MIDDRLENALAEELAAYQEKLERGECEPSLRAQAASGDPLPAELQQELENQKRCLDLLHSLRQPRRPEIDLSGQSGPIDTRHDGRFQILDELGSGGFGIVWRARDPATGRIVALKVPRPEVLTSPELRKRFEQEAEAAARLDHPNIVPILEAGTDGVVPYIASTYYEGPTLAKWLSDQEGRVAPRQAALIALALAKALTHAHERGVLHRDVKPSNVLLAPVVGGEPRELPFEPKLMDFGLAKLGEREQELTRTGAMLGTLKYMAPEQAAGRAKEITAATDVYGLGVVLYELLSGATPFAAESDWLTLRQVLEVEPRSLSAVRRDVPRDLAVIVQKCLNKIPGQRYRGARELAEDLERHLAGKSILARPVPPAERLVKWCRRNPAWAALVGVVALSLVSGVAFLSYSNVRIAAALEAEHRVREQLSMRVYAADMRRAEEALDQNNMRHAREILEAYSPRSGETDLREFAWRLLWKRLPQLRAVTQKHSGPVYSIDVSPDGKWLATGCGDGRVRIWTMSGTRTQKLSCDGAEVNEVAFSPDGKWLAAACQDGLVRTWQTSDWTLRQTLPLGGVITTNFDGFPSGISAIAAADNDSIVVAGWRREPLQQVLVARYKANGALDPSFGQDGFEFPWSSRSKHNDAGAILLEPNGKSVVAGSFRRQDFAVGRFHPDGSIDLAFGDGGRTMIDVDTSLDVAAAMVRQPDEKYLVAGWTRKDGYNNSAIMRLTADGALDTSFGGDGRQINEFGLFDDALRSIALQADGKIVAAGLIAHQGGESSLTDFLVVRYNPDGALDDTFDDDGVRILHLSDRDDLANAVTVQEDGKILVAGYISDGRLTRGAVLRLNADGSFDTSFAEQGLARLDLGPPSTQIRSMVLQPDGKILVAGFADTRGTQSIAIARLNPQGTFDPSFGTGGRVNVFVGNGAEACSLVLRAAGRIVVGGVAHCGGKTPAALNFAVLRLLPDGTLDRTFSANGVQGVSFSPNSQHVVAYAEQCVRFWDVETGAVAKETYVPEGTIRSIDLSADGTRLVTSILRGAQLWNTAEIGVVEPSVKPGQSLTSAAFLPDGALAVGLYSGELQTYNNSTQKFTQVRPAQSPGQARHLRMSANRRLLATFGGNAASVYDTNTFHEVASIATHGRLFDVWVNGNGKSLITSMADGSVLESPIDAEHPTVLGNAAQSLYAYSSRISAAAFAPDERTIVCGHDDGSLALIDSSTGEVLRRTPPQVSGIRGIGFTGDDQLVVGHAKGSIVMFSASLENARELRSLGKPILRMAVCPNGSRLAVSFDESPTIEIMAMPSLESRCLIQHQGQGKWLDFTPEGDRLVVAGDAHLEVFDTSNGNRLAEESQLGGSYLSMQVCDGGKKVAVAEGANGLTFRELPTLRVLSRTLIPDGGVDRLAVSSEGLDFASSGADATVRIWDSRTREQLLTLDKEFEDESPARIHFSKDGKRLFVGNRNKILAWHAE